jgi:hypothetical protein
LAKLKTMNAKLTLIAFLCLSLFACKKSSTDTPTVPLISKVANAHTNGDRDTTYITFDASSRLKKMVQSGFQGGTYQSYVLTDITRNALGLITQFSEYGYETSAVYSDGSGHYTYSIRTTVGSPYIDSSVYTYTSGRITITTRYTKTGSGGTYAPSYKADFAYDAAGNVTLAQEYQYVAGSWQQLDTFTYVYDNKVNPIQSNNDGVVLDYPTTQTAIGPNNFTQVTYHDILFSTTDVTVNAFTYNSNNLPASVTTTINGVTEETSTVFY